MKSFLRNLSLPFCICIISILLLSVLISVQLYGESVAVKNSFRLHVVANSDTVEDQILKLKVTDAITQYISTLFVTTDSSKEEIYDTLYHHIDKILEIADQELIKHDVSYQSKIRLGKIEYAKKQNIYLIMESGSYDSIQILLGEAQGKNYWNLIFPNKENVNKLKNLNNILPGISNLYEDTQEKQEETKYHIKLVEFFQTLF